MAVATIASPQGSPSIAQTISWSSRDAFLARLYFRLCADRSNRAHSSSGDHLTDSILFRGWIPAVSGRLSFTVFGITSNPKPAESANVADAHCRYLVAYQKRVAGDALAPYFYHLNDKFWFVFIATTEDDNKFPQQFLVGDAFIFSDADPWYNTVLPEILKLQEMMHSYSGEFNGDLKQYIGTNDADLTSICKQSCLFNGSVKISRTGTTSITIDWPQKDSPHTVVLPETGGRRDYLIHNLAAQLFFFLKDLGHRHQHHHPRTDTVVDLHRYDGVNDVPWRLSTLYSIYRKIIIFKRNPHIANFNNCIGLVAYARAFESISKEELKVKEDEDSPLPIYYSHDMLDSIKSTQARVERDFAIRQKRSDTARTLIISITSLLVGFLGILKLSNYTTTVEPSPILKTALDLLLKYPWQSIGMIGTFVALFMWGSTARYMDGGWIKINVFFFLQAFRLWKSVGILLAAAALFFYAAYRILIST